MLSAEDGDFDAWATVIMRKSDSNRNAALSIVELQTMCAGTEHEGFAEWLTANRAKWFKEHDTDNSSTLDARELARALKTFHLHVASSDSQPLGEEGSAEPSTHLVARKMMEVLYKEATRYSPPSWKRLFAQIDRNSDGVVDFLEVEQMIRKDLLIPTSKVSLNAIRDFFAAIDRNKDGRIELSEFVRFMERMAREVSQSFASVNTPEDPTPPWLRPKSYEDLVAECRSRRIIGGFTSISKEGPLLPMRPEALQARQRGPTLSFPSATTVLHRDLRRNAEMK